MKLSTRTMVAVGMFVAVHCAFSVLVLPTPGGVPVTLQTFGMALCGYTLGWKRGGLSILVYILLGAVGVPVFSGMRGGLPVLFGYTGGFIWGFFFLTLLCGVGLYKKNAAVCLLLGIVGLGICHFLGVLQYTILTRNTLSASFLIVSLPYLAKDILSVWSAYAVARPIRKAFMVSVSNYKK